MRRAHRPVAAAESGGNLLVVELGQQQIEELSLARGQTLLARREEEAPRLPLHHQLLRSRTGIGPERVVGDGVGLMATSAQLVGDDIARNGEEPADESRVLVARGQGGEGAHKDALHGVLGRFAVAQPHQGEPVDVVEIAAIKQGVGLPIAVLGPGDERDEFRLGLRDGGAGPQAGLGRAAMLGGRSMRGSSSSTRRSTP